MALINCPECGNEVSDSATQCPKCGFGVKDYVLRQKKIAQFKEEAEHEAYEYVKKTKLEDKQKEEQKKQEELNRKKSVYHEAIEKYNSNYSQTVEEAKILFESIIDWEDSCSYIEKCITKMSDLKLKEEAEKLQDVNKKRKIKKIAIITTPLIIIFIVLYSTIIIPSLKYNKAIEYRNNGNLEESREIFSKLNGYKDSETQVLECDYQKALNLLDNEEYKESKLILRNLGNYKDSEYKIEEANYLQAMSYIKTNDYKNYELAATLLSSNDYKDSKAWGAYVRALDFENKGWLNSAYDNFLQVLDSEYAANLPDVTEHIELCKKYRDYCGIWENVNGNDWFYTFITLNNGDETLIISRKQDIGTLYSGDFNKTVKYKYGLNTIDVTLLFEKDTIILKSTDYNKNITTTDYYKLSEKL